MNSLIQRICGLAAVFLVTACAALIAVADTPVNHMTRDEVLAENTTLPTEGYLSTAQPTEAVLDKAAAAGYTTVIDFRGEDEDRGIDERAEVEARGMRYVSIPVATPDDATWDKAEELGEVLASVDGPVLMHCFSGNRAASMLAMTAKLEGASSSEALALGKRAGLTRWESQIQAILEAPTP